MVKVGIHYCYFIGTGIDDIMEKMEIAAKTGMDDFEFGAWYLYDLPDDQLKSIKAKAEDLGITHSCDRGLNATNDSTSPDAAAREKGIAMMQKLLGQLEKTGIRNISGINYGAWLGRPQVNPLTMDEKLRVMELSAQSLKPIAKVAEDKGICYSFELVNRFEQYLLNTVAEGLQLADMVGSPSIKLLLDTFHMNIEEDSIVDAIRLALGRNMVGEVHVGESNRRIPGTGKTHMDWAAIFGALKEGGYTGNVVMEPIVTMGTAAAYDVGLWRDLTYGAQLPQMIENIAVGGRFIRSFFS